MNCPNCGIELTDGLVHCPACDADLINRGESRRVCPRCGSLVAQRAETCLTCGASLGPALFAFTIPPRIWGGVAGLLLLSLIFFIIRPGLPGARQALVPTPTPTVTQTPTVTPTATLTPTPTDTPTPVPTPTPIVHVVQPGETLLGIAATYRTTVEAIMAANNITDPTRLRSGQELVIPPPEPGAPPAQTPAPLPARVIHIVQQGDSLISIAAKYNTTVDAIMAANNLSSPDLIYVGQQLEIPVGPPTPAPTDTPAPTLTPTPGPPYPAPILLAPPAGAQFRGPEQVIMLNWASVGILAEDEWYVVVLGGRASPEPPPSTWTKATAWRLPPELRPAEGATSHELTWQVTVMRRTGTAPDGTPLGEALSPPGEVRRFEWY